MSTSLTLRSTKGSPLTNSEIDGNFTALNTDKQEASDITYEKLDANNDIGPAADQVAKGDHLHGGVYEPINVALLKTGGAMTGNFTLGKGADVSSAAALALGADGNAFDILGTNNISTINTIAAGTIVSLRFTDALTLTHNATNLDLRDGVNITTYPGYVIQLWEYAAGNWKMLGDNKITDVGEISFFGRVTVPGGWLECDGSEISRTTYAHLFDAISTTWGVGDGSTTFNIPDMRGEFIRGFDNGAGNDPGALISVTGDNTISNAVITNLSSTTNMEAGMSISGTGIPAATLVQSVDSATQITLDTNSTSSNAGITFTLSNRTDRGDGTLGDVIGSKQAHELNDHGHIMPRRGTDFERSGSSKGPDYSGSGEGQTGDSLSIVNNFGGNETRPRNVQIMFCIKF